MSELYRREFLGPIKHFPAKTLCTVCGEESTQQVCEICLSSGTPGTAPISPDYEGWTCSYCNAKNAESQSRCTGCAQPYSPESFHSQQRLLGRKRKLQSSSPQRSSGGGSIRDSSPDLTQPANLRSGTAKVKTVSFEEETFPSPIESPGKGLSDVKPGVPRLGLSKKALTAGKQSLSRADNTLVLSSQSDGEGTPDQDVCYDDPPEPCGGCGLYADLHNRSCPVKYPQRKAVTVLTELGTIRKTLQAPSHQTVPYVSEVFVVHPGSTSGTTENPLLVGRKGGEQDQVGSSSKGTSPRRYPTSTYAGTPCLQAEYEECKVCGLKWTVSWVLRSSQEYEELSQLRRQMRGHTCPQCRSPNVTRRTRFYFELGCPFGKNWFDLEGYRSEFSASRDDAQTQDRVVSSLVEDEQCSVSDEDMDYYDSDMEPSSGGDSDDSELDQPERKARKTLQGRAAVHLGPTELGEVESDTIDEYTLEHLLHSN